MNGWVLGTDGSHWMGSANITKMYNARAKTKADLPYEKERKT